MGNIFENVKTFQGDIFYLKYLFQKCWKILFWYFPNWRGFFQI